MDTKCWVLWHRYLDGSGASVVRAYTDEKRAQSDLDLLQHTVSASEYQVDEVPLFRNPLEG